MPVLSRRWAGRPEALYCRRVRRSVRAFVRAWAGRFPITLPPISSSYYIDIVIWRIEIITI